MARTTAESERITAFSEPRQQLQRQVSDGIFRPFLTAPLSASIFALAGTPPRKRGLAKAVAVVDRVCTTARRALRLTAALLGVAAFAALGGTAQTASFTATQRTLGSGFNGPDDVVMDSSGNLFVADPANQAVKEILAAGGYTTVNTLAVANGHFINPTGVAVDGQGNVFVADRGNRVVKEILALGGYTTVNTLAVTNGHFISLTAVAVDASDNVFVADQEDPPVSTSKVKEILASGGYTTVNTLLTAGNTYNFNGVAVDANDNVFVSDLNQPGLQEILAAGGYATVNTLAASYGSFAGVAVDASANVYVIGRLNPPFGSQAVEEILAAGGYTTVNTLGGSLTNSHAVAVGASGTLYIAEPAGIVEVQPDGANFGAVNVKTASSVLSLVFTFATGGTLGGAAVLTLGATGLDFANAGTGTCTTNGASHEYSTGDTCTVDVTFTPTRPGQRLGAVQLMGSAGTPIATGPISGTGTGPMVTFSPPPESTVSSGFSTAVGVAVDGSGDVFVADQGNSAVKEIVAVNGVVSSSSTVNTVGSGFTGPTGVAVDGSGNVFVADQGNSAVKEIVAVNGVVSSSSTVNTVGSGFTGPEGVSVDGSGDVFVADFLSGAVKEIVAVNGVVSSSSTVNTVGSGFSGPTGVSVDGSGDVFVADPRNSTVKEIVAVNGVVSSSSTVNAVGSGFSYPTGVSADGSGNVFVADFLGSVVKEIVAVNGVVSSSSIVKTVGSGFSNPYGVSVDGSGDVFVADEGNSAVKEIDFAAPPALSFASTVVGATSSNGPQTVMITNDGNAALAFPVPGSGSNPTVSPAFPLAGSTTCPEVSSSGTAGRLAAGSSCLYAISFMPTAGGLATGSLAVTDTNLNAAGPSYAVQSILLSGIGVAQDVTLTTVSALPSPVTVGQPVTLTAVVSDTTAPATVPRGSVSFTDTAGTTVVSLNGGAAVPLVAGTATLPVTPTVVGVHTITANFVGATLAPIVRLAPQNANRNFASSIGTATLTVAGIVPTLGFAPIAAKTYGNAPFAVSATSASSGAVTFTVVSGPATIAGSTVTLTGAGTVALLASQAASGNYAAATANASFAVAPGVPTLGFAPIAAKTYGNPPFAVSATSASTGVVTYAVVSGPATIAGNMVTLTGFGAVGLSASQAASGNYAAATATTSFTVAPAPVAPVGFTLTTSPGSGDETVLPGGAAAFNLMLAPGSGAAYPDALTLSATGLPAGATVTFSPAMIPAGSGATPVTMTVQTINPQTARNAKPGGSLGTMALALLLPMAAIKPARRRLRKMPGLPVVLAVATLSLGAMVCLSGCGSSGVGFFNQAPKSYTVVVTATDTVTGAHSSTNVTLTVQ
jgi:sugar lactone lactonase YvrE